MNEEKKETTFISILMGNILKPADGILPPCGIFKKGTIPLKSGLQAVRRMKKALSIRNLARKLPSQLRFKVSKN